MSDTTQHILEDALTSALTQYQETMDEAFDVVPQLDIIHDDDFGAVTEMDGEDLIIRVTTGTVKTIANLWNDALADDQFQSNQDHALGATAEELTMTGLVWLMLHEMHHYQMGHFELLGRTQIAETFGSHRFAVAKRAGTPHPAIEGLGEEELPLAEPCLEMQADHDALEMVLDAYSKAEWPSLRARTAAISAVMMLIELEDARHETDDDPTHPKAATRIFQLLGHLIHMPSIQAMLAEQNPGLDLDSAVPTDQEQDQYRKEVVMPAFLDALGLARIADAEIISQDLGNSDNLFSDVEIALLVDPAKFASLKTEGARQWADLVKINGRLLSELGLV